MIVYHRELDQTEAEKLRLAHAVAIGVHARYRLGGQGAYAFLAVVDLHIRDHLRDLADGPSDEDSGGEHEEARKRPAFLPFELYVAVAHRGHCNHGPIEAVAHRPVLQRAGHDRTHGDVANPCPKRSQRTKAVLAEEAHLRLRRVFSCGLLRHHRLGYLTEDAADDRNSTHDVEEGEDLHPRGRGNKVPITRGRHSGEHEVETVHPRPGLALARVAVGVFAKIPVDEYPKADVRDERGEPELDAVRQEEIDRP